MKSGAVRLTVKASALANKGRPWFFGGDLADGAPEDGDLVRVLSDRGRDLGIGFFSEHSKLKLRLCGPWPDSESPPSDDVFFRRRLTDASERRSHLRGARAGVRLVHGEADGLPGLVGVAGVGVLEGPGARAAAVTSTAAQRSQVVAAATIGDRPRSTPSDRCARKAIPCPWRASPSP